MMAARILSGKEYAAKIKEAAKREADSLGICPGLAVVMVGDNPASAVYVRNKNKACEELGFHSVMESLSADTTKEGLLAVIDRLNNDTSIHGILVQLPLPATLASAEQEVLNRISPDKDVDGFHPVNVGRLSTGQGALAPCTPAGCIRMLEYADIPMDGKHAVIIDSGKVICVNFCCVGGTVAQIYADQSALIAEPYLREMLQDPADVEAQIKQINKENLAKAREEIGEKAAKVQEEIKDKIHGV